MIKETHIGQMVVNLLLSLPFHVSYCCFMDNAIFFFLTKMDNAILPLCSCAFRG